MDSLMCLLATVSTVLLFTGHVVGDCQSDMNACLMQMPRTQPKPEEMAKYCSSAMGGVNCVEALKQKCPDIDVSSIAPMKQLCSSMSQGGQGGGAGAGAGMGGGECSMMKMQGCMAGLGSPDSPPADEDLKSNKDGICEKVTKAGSCVEMFVQKCAGQFGQTQEQIEGIKNSVAATVAKCGNTKSTTGAPKKAPSGGDSAAPEDGDNVDDGENAATSVQFSTLLVLLIPVFLQIWV